MCWLSESPPESPSTVLNLLHWTEPREVAAQLIHRPSNCHWLVVTESTWLLVFHTWEDVQLDCRHQDTTPRTRPTTCSPTAMLLTPANTASQTQPVSMFTSGMPQGSIVGPPSFLCSMFLIAFEPDFLLPTFRDIDLVRFFLILHSCSVQFHELPWIQHCLYTATATSY